MINMEWYHSLNKPLLNPPDWIFAPVWSVLYFLMAVSLILFIKGGFTHRKIMPLIFFIIQLILNFSWSGAFFFMQNIKLGFVVVCLMWVFILLTIREFYRFSKLASYLLVPYFLWTTFAIYLNLEYLRLN